MSVKCATACGVRRRKPPKLPWWERVVLRRGRVAPSLPDNEIVERDDSGRTVHVRFTPVAAAATLHAIDRLGAECLPSPDARVRPSTPTAPADPRRRLPSLGDAERATVRLAPARPLSRGDGSPKGLSEVALSGAWLSRDNSYNRLSADLLHGHGIDRSRLQHAPCEFLWQAVDEFQALECLLADRRSHVLNRGLASHDYR